MATRKRGRPAEPQKLATMAALEDAASARGRMFVEEQDGKGGKRKIHFASDGVAELAVAQREAEAFAGPTGNVDDALAEIKASQLRYGRGLDEIREQVDQSLQDPDVRLPPLRPRFRRPHGVEAKPSLVATSAAMLLLGGAPMKPHDIARELRREQAKKKK